MRNFKHHITELYAHVKKAEVKWPAGIKCISPSADIPPSEINRRHELAKAASEHEQSAGACSFLVTIEEELCEACIAANAGKWDLCYAELADAGAVVLRAMELIHPNLEENQP